MSRTPAKQTKGGGLARKALPDRFWDSAIATLERRVLRDAKAAVPASWPPSVAPALAAAATKPFRAGLASTTAAYRKILGEQLDRSGERVATLEQIARIEVGIWAKRVAEQRLAAVARALNGELERYHRLTLSLEKLEARGLHRFAARLGEEDPSFARFEVLRSPQCALGTALLLHWRALETDDQALRRELEKRLRQDSFEHRGVAYDPREDPLVKLPGQAALQRLHASVRRATTAKKTVAF